MKLILLICGVIGILSGMHALWSLYDDGLEIMFAVNESYTMFGLGVLTTYFGVTHENRLD